MMRVTCWVVAGSVVLTACGRSAPEVSDVASPGDVPEALALALITNAADESQMFVGDPPANVWDVLPSGSDMTVVGGLTRDNGGAIVFEIAESPETAFRAYGDRLEAEGWERAGERGLRGGFQQSPETVAATWCTETHWLRASSVAYAGMALFRVRYYEAELQPTPCENARMTSSMSMGRYGLTLPPLEAPVGAEVRMHGGGGSANLADMTASVITDLSAEGLFDHYSRQVGREGWEEVSTSSGNGIAIGRWVARDDEGGPAVGVLAIGPMPEANTYRAWIQMERVRSDG